MEINTLLSLSKDNIMKGRLPLVDLLANSAYYPSAGFDGLITTSWTGFRATIASTMVR